jgi:hypothetical protein
MPTTKHQGDNIYPLQADYFSYRLFKSGFSVLGNFQLTTGFRYDRVPFKKGSTLAAFEKVHHTPCIQL